MGLQWRADEKGVDCRSRRKRTIKIGLDRELLLTDLITILVESQESYIRSL